MTSDTHKRRLAAIMAIDIVGYSRMMEADEERTLEALRRFRLIVGRAVDAHGGRIFNTAGDAMIAEFESPVASVRAAIAVQDELAGNHGDAPDGLVARVGINVGDVLIDDGDLLGDSVNIAARLEQAADPGGILVSDRVYDYVRKQPELAVEPMGPKRFKNIANPVPTYRVVTDADRIAERVHEMDAAPTRAALIVLPFRNLSGDAGDEYLADGLTLEIIANLARFRAIDVLGNETSLALKGRPADPKSVGRELSVRYAIEGTLRRADTRLRVAASLYDTLTGQRLWSERYDRQSDDLFAIQDQTSAAIAAALDVRIEAALREAARNKGPEDASTYDLFLRGRAYHQELTPESHERCRERLERAVEWEPDYAAPYAELTVIYLDEIMFGYNPRPGSLERARTAAAKAVELDPDDARGHVAAANIHFLLKDQSAFERSAETALRLNENDCYVLSMLGLGYICLGQHDQGVTLVRRAQRLNPLHPAWYHLGLFIVAFEGGQYEDALAEIDRAHRSELFWRYAFEAAVCGQLGHDARAGKALATLLRLRPEFAETVDQELSYWHLSPRFARTVKDGLRRAGLDVEADPVSSDDADEVAPPAAPRPKSAAARPESSRSSPPAIAVLPFDTFGGADGNAHFADGLTEDIITALASWRSFAVIARNSTFAYKGRSPDIREVATDLGANYVLEGSVQHADPRIRVTAQLIDAATGHHVWADKFDREMVDIFAMQDDITTRIAAIVAPEVDKAEYGRANRRPTESLDAWDYFHRGIGLIWSDFTQDATLAARSMFRRAIDCDSGYSQAWSGLAATYHREVFLGLGDDRAAAVAELLAAARTAVALDETDTMAHEVLGRGYMWDRQFDLAIAECERAIALAPSNAAAYLTLGTALNFAGRPREAIENLGRLQALNPRDPRGHFAKTLIARTHLNAREPETAVDWAHKAIAQRADYPLAHLVLAASLGHLGRQAEATAAFETCERLQPGFAARWRQSRLYRDPADDEYFARGLSVAGVSA